ncbi:MAG: DNA repair protein RecN [candidate division KSB1 bacterium]|jgi:DNA repair protein RecN (Recombination protein N)|nr:DNA repair protein RecN [candidate division KSB1 bacterium]
MLKSLFVKNFALLDEIEVEFGRGLNIITGETGAGKSILIDALGSTLGEKISAEVLRRDAQKAVAEGLFLVAAENVIDEELASADIDPQPDNSLILRREMSTSGRSRAFVNDTPVTNQLLTTIGDHLVDLHGQHEHQSLLKVKYHLGFLDSYGNYGEALETVRASYEALDRKLKEVAELRKSQIAFTEKRDLFEFQIKDISHVDPHPGEEEELINEEKILRNSEKLFELTGSLYEKLYDSEGAAYEYISEADEKLAELSRIDSAFEQYRKENQSALVVIEELSKFLQSYQSNIEFNSQRLETIRERLSLFSGLKKKYGGSLEEVIDHWKSLEDQLHSIDNVDERLEELAKEAEEARKRLNTACLSLTERRRKAAADLEKGVVSVLSELGMPGARFKISIVHEEDENGLVQIDGKFYKTNSTGIDSVEFFISANAGEELKPLAKVASGGEVSRIMLAIKSALTESDKIPVLIFDEIDIGISGRIAQAVGRSLKKLSKNHQIICITHLPQIASMADEHFVVEKFSEEGSTHTEIRKLEASERPLEIAKLLGGDIVSESHIEGAKELLNQAQLVAD